MHKIATAEEKDRLDAAWKRYREMQEMVESLPKDKREELWRRLQSMSFGKSATTIDVLEEAVDAVYRLVGTPAEEPDVR